MSPDIQKGRGEVASVITSIAVSPLSCVVQAIITGLILEAIGVQHVRLGLGGLIFRCGVEPIDLMAYCDRDGYGFRSPEDGILYGHCFNLVGPNVVDMSLHDIYNDLTYLRLTGDHAQFPQNFTAEQPCYFWGPASSVRGKPRIPTKVGGFLITPFKGADAPTDFLGPTERDFINHAINDLAQQIVDFQRRYDEGDLLL